MGVDRDDGGDLAERPPARASDVPTESTVALPRAGHDTDLRERQLAEHDRYRQVVAASDREADGRDTDGRETEGSEADGRKTGSEESGDATAARGAWARAAPGLRAAWEEHRQRFPERERAASHTQSDGSWVGNGNRRLTPEQNAEAGKCRADLRDEAEQVIRPALERIQAADRTRYLAGLQNIVKGEDRLKEKLADAWEGRANLSIRQVLGMIPDAVRATLTYSSEGYARGVTTDIDRLKAEGFEMLKLKNVWDAEQYKGINSQWRRPDTGTRVELQFHTPESLEAKELTHEAYERLRAAAALPITDRDLTEEQQLERFQRQVNALIATPQGTDRIKDFPERNNG